MLRGASNSLFVYCNLYDTLLEAGDAEGAAALLQRSQRMVVRASGTARRATSPYMSCMWQANHGRWLLRRGQVDQAEAQMQAIHGLAVERRWHQIRRPMAMELARPAEERGELESAITWLRSMLQPLEAPLRDRLALRVHARLPALLRAVGEGAAAVQHQRQFDALSARIVEQNRLALEHVQDLSDLVSVLLAEADRRRLEDELARLRQQFGQGLGMPLGD